MNIEMPLHRAGDTVVAIRDLYSGLESDPDRFLLAQAGDKLQVLGVMCGIWDYTVVKQDCPFEGYFFVKEDDLCCWIGSFCGTDKHL